MLIPIQTTTLKALINHLERDFKDAAESKDANEREVAYAMAAVNKGRLFKMLDELTIQRKEPVAQASPTEKKL